MDIIAAFKGMEILRSKSNYLNFDKKPRASKVLVLSPHPDDEAIGCAGILYQHYLAKEKITVVFLTDGSQGKTRGMSEEEIIRHRKEEAKKAAKVLGIHSIIFWNYKDRGLCVNKESIEKMRTLINTVIPDVVYLPYFIDEHQDHWITNKIFIEACSKITYNFKVFTYEVWTPLIPNYLVNITKQMDKKLEALECYETQIVLFNIAKMAENLNAFRAGRVRLRSYQYAEAFFSCGIKEYQHLFNKVFEDKKFNGE